MIFIYILYKVILMCNKYYIKILWRNWNATKYVWSKDRLYKCIIIIQDNHAVIYRKDSDSKESTESQLCNPIYLTPAWLPLESWEYPYTSWCAEKEFHGVKCAYEVSDCSSDKCRITNGRTFRCHKMKTLVLTGLSEERVWFLAWHLIWRTLVKYIISRLTWQRWSPLVPAWRSLRWTSYWSRYSWHCAFWMSCSPISLKNK